MEYILQFARILGFCLAGEALHHVLPLPIPASIYGLLLLFLALETGVLKPERVKAASTWLIAVFPVMFIPGTVGVMELWEEMARLLVPILLAVFLVTALVFVVTGHVTQGLLFASGYAAQTMKRRKADQALRRAIEEQAAQEDGNRSGNSGSSGGPGSPGGPAHSNSSKKRKNRKKEARK